MAGSPKCQVRTSQPAGSRGGPQDAVVCNRPLWLNSEGVQAHHRVILLPRTPFFFSDLQENMEDGGGEGEENAWYPEVGYAVTWEPLAIS